MVPSYILYEIEAGYGCENAIDAWLTRVIGFNDIDEVTNKAWSRSTDKVRYCVCLDFSEYNAFLRYLDHVGIRGDVKMMEVKWKS